MNQKRYKRKPNWIENMNHTQKWTEKRQTKCQENKRGFENRELENVQLDQLYSLSDDWFYICKHIDYIKAAYFMSHWPD